MKNKRTAGMTLIELMITIALMAIVMTAIGGATVAGVRAYRMNHDLDDDQYNVRFALLTMTREIHKGVKVIDTDDHDADYLKLTMSDNTTVIYSLVDGDFKRNGSSTGITLNSFSVSDFDGARISLNAEGVNGLVIETTIAIIRVPIA